ncbi:multiple epidermal growth factor-like domains protein 6 [Dreissena polymorpha]|uniref:multiple epidermal growth factor-like domains protein 6 n=1 Tax=Dreissena polymorpha TaxID=45954 RepID=UPI002263F444|nr:multiple epidermal growth factor-like domains protein 6 [Dreissena polymorpha]
MKIFSSLLTGIFFIIGLPYFARSTSECPDGTYGLNCSQTCSTHCRYGNEPCNKADGSCHDGCATGYDYFLDTKCNRKCASGHSGWRCQPCGHCKDSECDWMTGECTHGCDSGWWTPICKTACDDGKYGLNCSQSCGKNCVDPRSCNKTNGACIGGCRPGYDYQEDVFCNIACERGYFGLNCTSKCHCKEGLNCDHVSGICSGSRCELGWTGDNCSIQCPDGTYGLNCSQTCSTHCRYATLPCNKEDGRCHDECVPGYDYHLDSKCTQKCASGHSGWRCQPCGHCKDSECDWMTGECTHGCDSGWWTPICKTACDDGKYGLNCSQSCGKNCVDPRSCNKTNGACIGGCRPGYDYQEDVFCNIACERGYFGLNCTSKCHCKEGLNCDHVSGICSGSRCELGWTGDNCSIQCPDGTYGLNCSQTCSTHCRYATLPCNKEDGRCHDECVPGYDYHLDSKCTQKCASGHSGWRCQPCGHCKDSECDWMTGECTHGCDSGWWTPICKTACDDGKYGLNCSQSCGKNCVDPRSCNKTNGACIGGCRPGYDYQEDVFCNIACERGYFGLNCTSKCHCKEGLNCDHVSGICSGSRCELGWTGDNCSIQCPDGTYGLNCSQTCSTHCRYATLPCNKEDGRCHDECVPGYDYHLDSKCTQKCASGHSGWRCQPCGHCKDSECDWMTGECTHGCDSGWWTPICKTACDDGKYGLNCSQSCGKNCVDPRSCNKTNGACIGGCRTGYDYQEDVFCNIACERGYFGLNCTSKCHCKEGLHCDHVSGICSGSRCELGWTGYNCSIQLVTNETTAQEPVKPLSSILSMKDNYIKLLLIIISVISTVLGLFSAAFILMFCIKRSRRIKEKPSANSDSSTKSLNLTSTSTIIYGALSITAQISTDDEQVQMSSDACESDSPE